MSPRTSVATRRELASVAPSVPGVPWWGAVLIAVVLTVVGMVIGGYQVSAGLPVPLWVGAVLGAAVAALAVRRRAVFTAMVQPPLVIALVVLITSKMLGGLPIVSAAFNAVRSFPVMAVATAVAVIIGLVRIAVQPVRRSTDDA